MKPLVLSQLIRAVIYLEFVKFLNWIEPKFAASKCLTSIFLFGKFAEVAKTIIRVFCSHCLQVFDVKVTKYFLRCAGFRQDVNDSADTVECMADEQFIKL